MLTDCKTYYFSVRFRSYTIPYLVKIRRKGVCILLIRGCLPNPLTNSLDQVRALGCDTGNPQVYFYIPVPVPVNTVPPSGTGAVFPRVCTGSGECCSVLYKIIINYINYILY